VTCAASSERNVGGRTVLIEPAGRRLFTDQAAIVSAEQNQPKLRVLRRD